MAVFLSISFHPKQIGSRVGHVLVGSINRLRSSPGIQGYFWIYKSALKFMCEYVLKQKSEEKMTADITIHVIVQYLNLFFSFSNVAHCSGNKGLVIHPVWWKRQPWKRYFLHQNYPSTTAGLVSNFMSNFGSHLMWFEFQLCIVVWQAVNEPPRVLKVLCSLMSYCAAICNRTFTCP